MEILILLVKVFVVFNVIMGLASFCTWFERKGSALIQDRIGANRAGTYINTEILILKPLMPILKVLGILGIINTLLCDAVKGLLKEDFVPEGVPNFLHCLAPFLAVFPVFVAYAVVPLSPTFSLFGTSISTQLAQVDAGVLFVLAMGSIAVYGVAMAGWTGNNKFSLLGGLRAAAQMISYELAMGLSIVTMVVIFGTLDLYAMVELQRGFAWGVVKSPLAPLCAIIFFIVGLAETKRGPFDLPESESELVAGYFTEYSGMKFLIFWLGEFAEIALFALVLALIFFGGWHFPGDSIVYGDFEAGTTHVYTWFGALVGHGVLMAKVVFLCILQIVIRWTVPRLRYDQLMDLGWKMLLPASIVVLMVTAAFEIGFRYGGM